MNRFENVDVLAALEQLMRQNTAFHRDDYNTDKEIIGRATVSDKAEDKTLLWMSRPSGTYCFRENDVFLQGTRQHNTWKFYGEQTRDTVLAYLVELTGKEDGKLKGNLYELDYEQHFRRVIEKSVPADNYTLVYEHGERSIPAGQYFDGNPDPQLGKFERFEAQPNDPEALRGVLMEEQRSREKLRPGDFKAHVTMLHDNRIEREACRVVGKMKLLQEPNGPDKTRFMVELSPYFVRLATEKDADRLFSMLPYQTLTFSKSKDSFGTYALIDKGEDRSKGIRKPRPSVRAQLAAGKEKTAPKKAAKTRQKEMEV